MVNQFLEQNIFLPGDEEEQEEQKKSWEQILAEDVAAQTAPPPPPPIASDIGFTEEAGGQAYAPAPPPQTSLNVPPDPINQAVPPPPPPPDPMTQAMGNLNNAVDDIMFQEQNTIDIPSYDPIFGYSQDIMAEGLGQFEQTYYEEEIQPLESELSRLGGYIEDWNNYGTPPPPEFLTIQDLQVAYDTTYSEYQSAFETFETSYGTESERLSNIVMDKLGSRQNIGQHRIAQDDFSSLFEQEKPADWDVIQIPNNALSMQYYLQQYQKDFRDGNIINDPDLDAARYGQESQAWNEQILREFGRTGDSSILTYMIQEPDFSRPFYYYDEQGNRRESISPYLAEDRQRELSREVGVGELLSGTATIGIGGLAGTIAEVTPEVVKEPLVTHGGAYVRGISEGSQWAWDQLPPGVQKPIVEVGSYIFEYPDQIAANYYVTIKNNPAEGVMALYNPINLVSAARGTKRFIDDPSVNTAIGITGSPGAPNQENLDRFNEEVPVGARVPIVLGLSIFVDPLNLVAPVKWGKRGADAYYIAKQKRALGVLVDDAFKTSDRAADKEFLAGVSTALNQGLTVQDVAKHQNEKRILNRLQIIGKKADEGLTDEFEQRVSYRLFAANDPNRTEQIISEELGRISEKGQELGINVRADDTKIADLANQINDVWDTEGVEFWTKAFPEGEQLAAKVDAAWLQARDDIVDPYAFLGPVDQDFPGIESLVRWGSGPEDVFNGRYYANMMFAEQEAGEFGRLTYVHSVVNDAPTINASPATRDMQDLIETEYIARGWKYEKPQNIGEATQMLDRVRKTSDIPLPPGASAVEVVNSVGYQRVVSQSYDEYVTKLGWETEKGLHATKPQLVALETRSRLAQVNLFDQLAVDSRTAKAFTRQRADELIRNAPATERQKGLLRDLSQIGPDGKRIKTVKRQAKDGGIDPERVAPIVPLTLDEIDTITYSDAQKIIHSSIMPYEDVEIKSIWSMRDGDINATLQLHGERRVAAEMKSILDDLIIREGKEGPWTHWHTLRVGPEFIIQHVAGLFANGGKPASSLLQLPGYGQVLESLGKMRDVAMTRDQYDIARMHLAALVELADDAPLEHTGQIMRFFIDMTEGSIKAKRYRRSTDYIFQRIKPTQLTNADALDKGLKDLMMRRAIYTADMKQLQKYDAFSRVVGVDVTDLRGMGRQDAIRYIREKGNGFAKTFGAGRLRSVTREFFGSTYFTADNFAKDYSFLKSRTDQLAKEMRELEDDLVKAAERIGDTRDTWADLRNFSVHDSTKKFADDLRIQYTTPREASLYTPPPSPGRTLPITNDRVRARAMNRVRAWNAARADSTAEVARAHQIHAIQGGAKDLPEDRLLPVQRPDPTTGNYEGELAQLYGSGLQQKVSDVLTGIDTKSDIPRSAAQFGQRLKRVAQKLPGVGGNQNVTFGTSVDEAMWKIMTGEVDDETAKRLGEVMNISAGAKARAQEELVTRMGKAARLVRDAAGEDAPMHIHNGQIKVGEATRDRLLSTIKATPEKDRDVSALNDVWFKVASGSDVADEWRKIPGFNLHDRIVDMQPRPTGRVFNPIAKAVGNVKWEESGEAIDRAIKYSYEDDWVWNVPGERKSTRVAWGKGAQVARIGDDTHLFMNAILQQVMQEPNIQMDSYKLARQVGDLIETADPIAMNEFGHIFNNSEEGRRWLRWMRAKGDDGVSNWKKLRSQWDRYSPHFSVAKMPSPALDLVTDAHAAANGKTIFTDLGKLNEIIHDPAQGMGKKAWEALDADAQQDVIDWADYVRHRWNTNAKMPDSERVGKIYQAAFQKPDGSWKKSITAQDLDAHLFPQHALEISDIDAFLDNVGTAAGHIEAQRIGYDPSLVPWGMGMQRAIKGNLGYFWLGTPRYLIMNIAGNIMSELLYMAHTGGHGGIGAGIPKVVLNAWDEGYYMPRQLTSAFQSLATEDPLRMNAIRKNAREAPPELWRPDKWFGRDGDYRRFRTERQADRASSGTGTIIPRQLDRKYNIPGRAITGVIDGIQWASEGAEIWSRRRIYGRELWASYQHDFNQSLDLLGDAITPELRRDLTSVLKPEDVSALLSDVNPVVRKRIMKAHSQATSYGNLTARYMTEKSLRDYRMRNRFDEVLDKFSPYHFWTTKNLLFFAETVAHRPSVAVHGMRAFDSMSEAWDEMPQSFRGKLQLFNVPEHIPGIGGSGLWLRPDNLTNPAFFIAAMTTGDIQQAWDRHKDMSVGERLFQTGKDGLRNLWENMGFRFGPQWEYPTAFADARVGDANDPNIPIIHKQLFGDVLPGVVYPHGYRPSEAVPLAGYEQIIYGINDKYLPEAIENVTGKEANWFKLRQLNEFANKTFYGNTFTNNDILFLGKAVGVPMLRDGEFGDVEVDDEGNIIGISDEAARNYFNVLMALNEDNLDDPYLRKMLDSYYEGETVRSALSIAGAPVSMYTPDWKESAEGLDKYFEIKDEMGSAAAKVWARGEWNSTTGRYEGGEAYWIPYYFAVTNNTEELQSFLDFIDLGTAIPQSFVNDEGELVIYDKSGDFGNLGINSRHKENNAVYYEARRSENREFNTRAKPYFDDINAIRESVDHKVNKELAKPADERNMAYVELMTNWGNQQVAEVFNRATEDGVNLQRPKNVPRSSSAWWKMDRENYVFLEENMTAHQISAAKEQAVIEAQTNYVLDIVAQNLGIELYDENTGEIKQEFMRYNPDAGEWSYDPELYEAAKAEAAELAPEAYRKLLTSFASDPDNPLLLSASGGITSEQFTEHLNENVIPELEEWQARRSETYEAIGSMDSGPEKDAAIQAAREEFGEDFYRFGPNVGYIIDHVAGDVMAAFGEMPIADQQGFIEQYPHLFDNQGNFRSNKLTIDDINSIATEYNMDIPHTESDLIGLADNAKAISTIWYDILTDKQKDEWREVYGNEDHPYYIEGLFVRDVWVSPDTGEEQLYWRIDSQALGPNQISLILEREGINPQHWGDAYGSPEGDVGLDAEGRHQSTLIQVGLHQKEMDNSLGQFWTGESYLTPEEQDNYRLFNEFRDSRGSEVYGNTTLEEAAKTLRDQVGADLDRGYARWEETLEFAIDPKLYRYIADRIAISDRLGIPDIRDKQTDYLTRTKEGKALVDYFSDNDTIQTIANFAQDPPALREFKDGVDSGELWASDADELARWQEWQNFTGFDSENADKERLLRQIKKDAGVTWRELPDLLKDPELKEYAIQRQEMFENNEVASMWGNIGQYLLTSEGQAGYEMDPEAFSYYLGFAADSGSSSGGGGGSSKGKGYGGSQYGSNYYGNYTRGSSGYSSQRSGGFARTTIDDYQSISKDVFFLDEAMVSGQAGDAEQRMYYATRIADRLKKTVDLISMMSQNPMTRESTQFVIPFLSLILMNIENLLGEEPTLDGWKSVFEWLQLEDTEAQVAA